MAYVPQSGSVVAFQGNPSVLQAVVAVTNTPSISGTVNIGTTPGSVVAFQGTNPWVIGSVLANVSGSVVVSNFPTTQNVSGSVVAFVNGTVPVNAAGSVVAFQGTSPWVVAPNNSSLLSIQPAGSVLNVNISGSVATVGTAAANQSVSGTVQVDVRGSVATVIIGGSVATATTNSSVMLLNSANVVGSVATLQGTSPWVVNFQNSSIFTGVQGSVAVAIVSGSVAVATGNSSVMLLNSANVIGSVAALQGTSPWVVNFQNSSIITQIGTRTTSLVSTIPSSVIVGASIFGQLPAGTAPIGSVAVLQGTLPWAVAGSVAAVQATSPWVVNFQNSSILATPVGSTIVMVQANSIVGTYAEDAAHTTGDKGVFILGVRNDAVASFVAANLEYGPMATDSAGRGLIKPFSSEDGTIISYFGSVVSGSVTLVQASVIGKKSYVTDFALGNSGSTTTLVTFQGGDTSLLGQFIVPAGGGNNKVWQIPLKTNVSQDLAFKVVPSQSILYAVVKGYQAP